MTPRLRILSIGLAISLAYAIYDYVDRNNNNKSVACDAVVRNYRHTFRPLEEKLSEIYRLAENI